MSKTLWEYRRVASPRPDQQPGTRYTISITALDDVAFAPLGIVSAIRSTWAHNTEADNRFLKTIWDVCMPGEHPDLWQELTVGKAVVWLPDPADTWDVEITWDSTQPYFANRSGWGSVVVGGRMFPDAPAPEADAI